MAPEQNSAAEGAAPFSLIARHCFGSRRQIAPALDWRQRNDLMQPKKPQAISLRLSRAQLTGICLTALGLAAGTTLGGWGVAEGVIAWGEIERLRADNERLLNGHETLVSRLWKLQLELTTYERRTQELAQVAGVDIEEELLGMGGLDPESGPTSARLDTLADRSVRLARMLDDVESRLAAIPSAVPARGPISSRFGYRLDPLTGERSFHRGVDIDADPGEAVHAAASGVVRVAGRKGALGNAVRLVHGSGLTTRYGHLSEITVAVGEEVEQGDVVGYVGRTGRATGYHLHFEILFEGRPVDPLQYIEGSRAGP